MGSNDKDGVTLGIMSNHYLFTSFPKLEKRGGELVKACKKGIKFDWT